MEEGPNTTLRLPKSSSVPALLLPLSFPLLVDRLQMVMIHAFRSNSNILGVFFRIRLILVTWNRCTWIDGRASGVELLEEVDDRSPAPPTTTPAPVDSDIV